MALFTRLGTQWLIGNAGATGLNHLVILAHIDRMHLPSEEADRLFDDVCIMEKAALAAIHAPA